MSESVLLEVVQAHADKTATMARELAATEPEAILQTARLCVAALHGGHQVLVCGNGGSAAQAQHFAAELVVRLRGSVERRALRALALTTDTSILTACANDYGFEQIFARQVEALGQPDDVLVGLSTSGRSPNVLAAFAQARTTGLKTILWTGRARRDPGRDTVDVAVCVPSTDTMFIQEGHLAILHVVCDLVERILFPEHFTL